MIPISLQNEPESFDKEVRIPGLKFLKEQPCFKDNLPANHRYHADEKKIGIPSKKWKTYWCQCRDDLYEAYGGICAYLSIALEEGEVDHFLPKSRYYGLAYEWSNYRLAAHCINNRKGTKEDFLDPFSMPEEVFHLDIEGGSFELTVNQSIDDEIKIKAIYTINELQLNLKHHCNSRKKRFIKFMQLMEKDVDAEFMKEESPFLWSEIQRQKISPTSDSELLT